MRHPLYLQKLALTLPTSGGPLDDKVRLQTKVRDLLVIINKLGQNIAAIFKWLQIYQKDCMGF
jgi:hypothetical protein